MEDIVTFHHNKLGDICYRKGPQTIHCWSGIIDGCKEVFSIILNNSDLETVDIDFIVNVIRNKSLYIEKALDFIRLKLHSQPELVGLDTDESKKYLAAENLPFSLPKFLFYEKHEWIIHFMECSFPIGDQCGIGIEFYEENPTSIENFSESEEIDDDE